MIHADGVWGGLGPRGDLHLSFFSERLAIPRQLELRVDEKGQPHEDHSKRVVRCDVVREIECDVVMSIDNAVAFRDWLNEKIAKANEIRRPEKEESDNA